MYRIAVLSESRIGSWFPNRVDVLNSYASRRRPVGTCENSGSRPKALSCHHLTSPLSGATPSNARLLPPVLATRRNRSGPVSGRKPRASTDQELDSETLSPVTRSRIAMRSSPKARPRIGDAGASAAPYVTAKPAGGTNGRSSRPHRWAPVAASRHTTPFLVSTYRTAARSGPSINPVISLVAWKRQSGMVSDRAVLERSSVPVRARLTGGVTTSQTPMSGKPHPTACARRMCASPVWFPDRTNAKLPCVGSSAILESFVACECSVAEETRTRGFASPALAGFALVDGAFLTELLIRHRQRRVK